MEEHDYSLLGAFILVDESTDDVLKENIIQHLPTELHPYFLTPKGIIRIEQEFNEITIKLSSQVNKVMRVEVVYTDQGVYSSDFLNKELVLEVSCNKKSEPVQRTKDSFVVGNKLTVSKTTKEESEERTKYMVDEIKGFFQDAVNAMKPYSRCDMK